MPDLHRFLTPDPRDEAGVSGLTVEIAVQHYGTPQHGYGEHFDPGSGPDFDIRSARDPSGRDVLKRLSADEVALIEEDVTDRFDFARAKHEADEADAHDERGALVR